jgi:hypothetical protein
MHMTSVALVALLASCSPERETADRTGAASAEPQNAPAAVDDQTMASQVKMIDDAELTQCLEGGVVALVQVETAEIVHPGTRSEMVVIEAKISQAIHGEVSQSVRLQRYTSGGNTVLAKGKSYVVAGAASTRWTPAYALVGFVEVPPGNEQEYADAHKEAIERLRKSP